MSHLFKGGAAQFFIYWMSELLTLGTAILAVF